MQFNIIFITILEYIHKKFRLVHTHTFCKYRKKLRASTRVHLVYIGVRTDNGRYTLLKHCELHLTDNARCLYIMKIHSIKIMYKMRGLCLKTFRSGKPDWLIYNYLVDFPNVDAEGAVQFSKSPSCNFMNGDRFIYIGLVSFLHHLSEMSCSGTTLYVFGMLLTLDPV